MIPSLAGDGGSGLQKEEKLDQLPRGSGRGRLVWGPAHQAAPALWRAFPPARSAPLSGSRHQLAGGCGRRRSAPRWSLRSRAGLPVGSPGCGVLKPPDPPENPRPPKAWGLAGEHPHQVKPPKAWGLAGEHPRKGGRRRPSQNGIYHPQSHHRKSRQQSRKNGRKPALKTSHVTTRRP